MRAYSGYIALRAIINMIKQINGLNDGGGGVNILNSI